MLEHGRAVVSRDEAARLVEVALRIDADKAKAEEVAAFRADLERLRDAWRVFGDMVPQAERTLVNAYKLPKASKESLVIGLRHLRRDLGYDDAPALEKMVIEQVVLSWLRLSLTECQEAVQLGNATMAQSEYWARALSSAQRRHLRAVETLARLRRLLRPVAAVQVNVGGQQINLVNT